MAVACVANPSAPPIPLSCISPQLTEGPDYFLLQHRQQPMAFQHARHETVSCVAALEIAQPGDG